jgi:dTMP kinase
VIRIDADTPREPPGGLVVRPGGHGLRGRLIVLEGIDGSGRSTHVRLLEDTLRYRGHAVTRASIGTSAIAGEPIRRSKADRSSGPVETTLLYAADIAERIEQQILPSLGAGLIVLADRYTYTPMARAEARGLDRDWLEAVFSFGVAPDAVLFLDVDPTTTFARREPSPEGRLSRDALASYRQFQEDVYACFDAYADRYQFRRISGNGTIQQVERRLERDLMSLLGERVAPAALP